MRATLVCRQKRRRAAWRTRGGGDSFSAEGILAAGGHAPCLRSRPERASDMHPQAPNTQAFLPACLLPTVIIMDFQRRCNFTLPSERKPTTNIVVFFVIERTQNVGHGATGRLPLFACSCRSHVPDN